jgi:hypothetical protein
MRGLGTLAALGEDFQERLAAVLDEAQQTKTELARRWLAASRWPRSMRVNGLSTRLTFWCSDAHQAKQNGRAMYCWYGPSVQEYAIAHGHGQQEYEAYRGNKSH